ncbi:MAG TPA: tetratricopeptide repeat protein [Bacteroidota bacterium]|nr:tetratricopeptide repeat protein [Bacteroidota bacterium]
MMNPKRLTTLLFSILVNVSLLTAQSADAPPQNQKVEADKLYNEGNSFYKTGNYLGAIEKYKSALNLHKDYRYYYQLGLSQKNAKRHDEAIAAFEEALKLKPDLAIGYNALGGTHMERRTFDKAIEAFKQALKYDPQMDRAKKGLSEAYAGNAQELINEGKISEANALVDEALAQHSDNAKLYLLAAIVYNKMERPEKALEAAQEAIKLKKRGSKGAEYFEVGLAYKKMKDYEKARVAFQEAKKDPAYSRNAQYELDGLKGK